MSGTKKTGEVLRDFCPRRLSPIRLEKSFTSYRGVKYLKIFDDRDLVLLDSSDKAIPALALMFTMR